jgi:lipopolysaccharide cholinephosphotransferase
VLDTDDLRHIQLIAVDILVEIDKIFKENNIKYYLGYGSALGAVRYKGFIPWDYDIDIVIDINNYRNACNLLRQKLPNKYLLESIETNKNYEELFARVTLKNELHQKIHVDIFPLVGAPRLRINQRIFAISAYIIYRSFFIKKVNVKINYKNKILKRRIALFLKFILMPIPANLFIWLFNKLSILFPIEESEILYNFCGAYGKKELVPKKFYGTPVKMMFEGYEMPLPQEWHKYLTNFYGDYMVPRKENYV